MSNSYFSEFGNLRNSSWQGQAPDEESNPQAQQLRSGRALWRAVILQAIMDILSSSKRTENHISKINAKKWIFEDNSDFDTVCSWAGYTRQYVRKRILDVLKKADNSQAIIEKFHQEEMKLNPINRKNKMLYQQELMKRFVQKHEDFANMDQEKKLRTNFVFSYAISAITSRKKP